MSKPWIVFLFFAWTAALLVLAPFFFTIYRTSVSKIEVAMLPGLPPIKYTMTTKQSILDWTGRLSATYTDVMFDDEILYSSVPGRSGCQLSAKTLSNYSVTIGQDGKPTFKKNEK